MGEFLGYMSFSLLEAFAVYSTIFYLFRIDLLKHLSAIVIVITVINLQSYFIREELSLSTVSPIINLLMTAIFLIAYLRIPLIWSLIMTITGYISLGILQTGIIYLSFGYFSLQEASIHTWKVYEVQALTGLLGFIIGYLIYKFGYGFSFEFEKFRFQRERIFIAISILLFIISLFVMMIFESIFSNLLVFCIALFILLIYYLRKDAEED